MSNHRIPAYLEVARILMEEEVAFSVTDHQDFIEILDNNLTVTDLYTTFCERDELLEATYPDKAFALKNVDEAFVRVVRVNDQLSLKIGFMEDE